MAGDGQWGTTAVEAAHEALRPRPIPDASRSAPVHETVELALLALGTEHGEPKHLALDHDWFGDVGAVLVDAIIAADAPALRCIDTLMRRVDRAISQAHLGRGTERIDADSWQEPVDLVIRLVQVSLERLAPTIVAFEIANGREHQFLKAVASTPGLNSREVGRAVQPNGPAIDDAQLSRLGSKLQAKGLLFALRTQRGLCWDLTPRGRTVLGLLEKSAAEARV